MSSPSIITTFDDSSTTSLTTTVTSISGQLTTYTTNMLTLFTIYDSGLSDRRALIANVTAGIVVLVALMLGGVFIYKVQTHSETVYRIHGDHQVHQAGRQRCWCSMMSLGIRLSSDTWIHQIHRYRYLAQCHLLPLCLSILQIVTPHRLFVVIKDLGNVFREEVWLPLHAASGHSHELRIEEGSFRAIIPSPLPQSTRIPAGGGRRQMGIGASVLPRPVFLLIEISPFAGGPLLTPRDRKAGLVSNSNASQHPASLTSSPALSSSMSLTNSAPSLRGQCVEHTDYTFCLCSHFFPARDAHYCTCGHGIHAHVDYISMVVHHCPATHCVAYVQDTPQTQECTCAAPLIDHVPIVNPYRTPAALPYRAEFIAGGVQSNVATPSNAVAASSPNIANLILSPPSLDPSPSHQLYPSEPTIQADIPGHYPNTNDGFYVDAANGQLYNHSNMTYSMAPDMNATPYA